MLISGTSPRPPVQRYLSFLGPDPRRQLYAPQLQPFSRTYMGDGVSVEFGDGFQPFQVRDQFVVTFHLNSGLVGGDRGIRVIAADHPNPCVLSFPFCTELPPSPLQAV